MFRRILIGAAAAAAVYAVTAALAASLGGLTTESLGADASGVSSCDADGITTDYAISFTSGSYVVDSVTVSGIDDTCDGGTLHVTLSDSSDTALVSDSTSIPSSTDTSVGVTLSSPPLASAVVNVDAAIEK